MRFRFAAAVLFAASTSIDAQQGAAVAEPPERLTAAIERALADNPGILEMEQRIEAARARIPQARSLPEPMLTVGAINVPLPSFSFHQDEMTMKMVSLEQEIPGAEKRSTAAAAALADAEATEAMHADHANRLAAGVAETYFELASLDARLEIARRTLERLKGVSESVRSRYRVGEGSLPDALLAGVQETRVRDRIRTLEAERSIAAIRFNALQNLTPETPVAQVALPPSGQMPERKVLAEALEGSPRVRQAKADIRRAEQELELARLGKRLDFKLMASYGDREGHDDMFGATVGINLPFARGKRVSGRIAEKEAELSAAKARLAGERLALSREIGEASIALTSDADRAALFRDTILTQDRTAARAAEEAYAVGKIDFQTYVGAVLTVDEDESEAIERETGISRARARLQAATGIPFYGRPPQEATHD